MRNVYTDPDGRTFEWESPDPPRQPLDPAGVQAALNAVLGIWTLQDAANTVGLTPDDLIAEAEAWVLGGEQQWHS